jgi:peptidyl-tRNA hydrolase, PTH1 family
MLSIKFQPFQQHTYSQAVQEFFSYLLPVEREKQERMAIDNLMLSLEQNFHIISEKLARYEPVFVAADAVFRQSQQHYMIVVIGRIEWDDEDVRMGVRFIMPEEFDQDYGFYLATREKTQYEIDGDAALLSLDESQIRAYYKQYGLNLPSESQGMDAFWAEVHFQRENRPSLSMQERLKSKFWLDEHHIKRDIGPYSLDARPSEEHPYAQKDMLYVQPVYRQERPGTYVGWLELIGEGLVIQRIPMRGRFTNLDDVIVAGLVAAQHKTREVEDAKRNMQVLRIAPTETPASPLFFYQHPMTDTLSAMTDWYLIVGLGNPGKEYTDTRHNVGFRVVDELARRYGLTFGKKERKAIIATGVIDGKKVILAKPQTFMNLSGEAVRALVDFYKIEPANILVVSDDIDIPLGTVRVRKSGGAGGQGGMKSVIQQLGTQDFNRLRFGVSRPPGKMQTKDYVLGAFQGDEAILASQVVDRASDAVETWLRDGVELAMTRHNGDIDEPKPAKKQPAPPEPK